MKCEYCEKSIRQGDILHGIKYGTLTHNGFKPAQDSSVTVLCGQCANQIYRLVYSSLDSGKPTYPTLLKMYDDLKASMKNGYKLIQAISKLPVQDQTAIERLITICKESK
ncbi:hypothetical protein [Geoanaerobacter pelophilus]|nr:hypothetical protein [Geoanaerobacter pelophilus]